MDSVKNVVSIMISRRADMAVPTKKSPDINGLVELFLGKNRVNTIIANKCMTCDGYAKEFRDKFSEKEYTISGMCQGCQDEVFS